MLSLTLETKDKILTAAASDLDRPLQEGRLEEPDHLVDEPVPGDRAAGYGLQGRIEALRARQPLAQDGIWRVSLRGECGRRLVRRDGLGFWQLLQIDDLTDAQLEAYDQAMQHHPDLSADNPCQPRSASSR